MPDDPRYLQVHCGTTKLDFEEHVRLCPKILSCNLNIQSRVNEWTTEVYRSGGRSTPRTRDAANRAVEELRKHAWEAQLVRFDSARDTFVAYDLEPFKREALRRYRFDKFPGWPEGEGRL